MKNITSGKDLRVNQRNPEVGHSVEWAQVLQVTVAYFWAKESVMTICI